MRVLPSENSPENNRKKVLCATSVLVIFWRFDFTQSDRGPVFSTNGPAPGNKVIPVAPALAGVQ
jgi:hypothetical protein